MKAISPAQPAHIPTDSFLCIFNSRNQLWIEEGGGEAIAPRELSGSLEFSDIKDLIASEWSSIGAPKQIIAHLDNQPDYTIWMARCEHSLDTTPAGSRRGFWLSIKELRKAINDTPERWDVRWSALLNSIHQHAIEIPYLNFGRNEFIYRFRTDKQRNREIYQSDEISRGLYQSRLCAAVKAARRIRENTSGQPARLNFGRIEYILPSHFGFCLGVQNAIERAYEVIAAHPGKRVFMLSELIHNPFVNKDLQRRGLRYLQTDKGVIIDDPATGTPYWETLTAEDIVIVPAFGATNEDKVRLVERGLPFNEFDATCRLVEKVWKAGRRFADEGYTVVIHGKAEHEETKATFSNIARSGPALVVRDRAETELLASIIEEEDPEKQRRLFAQHFEKKATKGFETGRDLQKIAVVNQTTLLRNETLSIIEMLEAALKNRYPETPNLHPRSRGDTLCYATQVNQDALQKALEEPLDLALVAGGKNSSNTYQLYRVCRARLGEKTAYIQSEENILSRDEVLHYHFAQNPSDPLSGAFEKRPLEFSEGKPLKVLITGGASCPDGIIQQIICRLNSFFPDDELTPIEDILQSLEEEATPQ
jgi:4-hydroxy-3-methylbut-2-enyl diphosphate reductase